MEIFLVLEFFSFFDSSLLTGQFFQEQPRRFSLPEKEVVGSL